MDPRRLLPVIALGEGMLLAIAVAWAWWAQIPLPPGGAGAGILSGTGAALVLGAINLALLRARGNAWPGGALRHVCRVIVRPVFEHVRVWHILAISAVAGAAEELLFRGVLQPLVGLPAASVVFGAVHVGGRSFFGYGAWAACIGAVFGLLMVTTGGVLAPIVAHAVYDALALAYVRYGPTDVCD